MSLSARLAEKWGCYSTPSTPGSDAYALEERSVMDADRIAELLDVCLRSTYFRYHGDFYQQKEGAAMGSPVSAVVANLYMEFFEDLALASAPKRPRMWKRYVDDTCCIVQRGTGQKAEFPTYLYVSESVENMHFLHIFTR